MIQSFFLGHKRKQYSLPCSLEIKTQNFQEKERKKVGRRKDVFIQSQDGHWVGVQRKPGLLDEKLNNKENRCISH